MKRCPACGTVFTAAEGVCPADGVTLIEVTVVGGGGGSSELGTGFACPPLVRAGAGRGGTAPGFSQAESTFDPASTGQALVPPQARIVPPQASTATQGPPPDTAPEHDSVLTPASTGRALIPPLSPGIGPGIGRAVVVAGANSVAVQQQPQPRSPARTVVAMLPPQAKLGVGANVGIAGQGPAIATAAAAVVAAPAPAPADAAGDTAGDNSGVIEVSGAVFPAGGLAKPRGEPGHQRFGLGPNSWEASLIGRVLDQRYRIESCLGAGAMGVVYKARHVIIDKPLAIKMLRSDVASQPDVVQRFLLEAQLASRVKHPNVVDISDYGQLAGQTAYYVMEYLVGETLAARIDRAGGLEPTLAIDIALQTAHALQAAHANKIIHRDLKSENIFLCEGQNGGTHVKILDFGIARIRDQKTRLTALGALIGTPAYMSPEQAQGADVDERSDLYALGVIVFEMLAGRVPFKAPTVALILNAQLFDNPPALREVWADAPSVPNIEHIIRRLLAKNRDERPRDAAEAIHLLRTAAEVDLSDGSPGTVDRRRSTVTLGSWSVAETPAVQAAAAGSGVVVRVAGPGLAEVDAAVPRTVSASGRIQRRPSVIVPSGTPVERIAAPPTRPPRTGEIDLRQSPTGVQESVRSNGPPLLLIIAAAASIVAAITVALYKQVWRRPAAPPVMAPANIVGPAPALQLVIDSDPRGATVIDERGQVWGTTPLTRPAAVDDPLHHVTVRFAGHEDSVLEITSGGGRYKVALRPQVQNPPPPAPEVPAAPEPASTPADPPAGSVRVKSPTKTKTLTSSSSKTLAPTGAATKPVPPPPEDDDLDMGELKNPFRKK